MDGSASATPLRVVAGLLIVDWQRILDGWGFPVGFLILTSVTGAVARWWTGRNPYTTPPGSIGQSATSGDHCSPDQLGGRIEGGVHTGGPTNAERQDIARYVFDVMRKEGFLPGVGPETTPQQLAFQEQEATLLLTKAMKTLPEQEEVAFTLGYYEGLTMAEIAEVLGASISTIERIHRSALLLLAEKVGPAFDIPESL